MPDAPLSTAQIVLPDEAATDALGAALAAGAAAGLYLALSGDLGAGKTALARALLHKIGVVGRIRSPSFTLVEPYNPGDLAVFHFDFYRFSSPDEWTDAGFDEYFDGTALCVVEWPERADAHLRRADLHITLEQPTDGSDGRVAQLRAYTEPGQAWLNTALRAFASSQPTDGGH